MKKLLAILFLSFLYCDIAFASKTISYEKYKKNPDLYAEHIKSVETGMSFTMVFYKSDRKISYEYCKPRNMAIKIDDLKYAISLGERELRSIKMSKKEIDEFPVGMIMFVGLKKLYPCK